MSGLRICLFGNSHLGALSRAEEGNANFRAAGHDIMYWGGAGSVFRRIVYADGMARSPYTEQAFRISGGRTRDLDIASFDVIVFYGFHIGFSFQCRRIMKLLASTPGLSRAVREDVIRTEIEEWWRNGSSTPLIEKILADFPGKTYLFYPQPLIVKHDGFFPRSMNQGLAAEIIEDMIAHCRAWMQSRGVSFRRQPECTIIDRIYTSAAYAKKPVASVADHDYRHMTAKYGEVILADLFEALHTSTDDYGAKRGLGR